MFDSIANSSEFLLRWKRESSEASWIFRKIAAGTEAREYTSLEVNSTVKSDHEISHASLMCYFYKIGSSIAR